MNKSPRKLKKNNDSFKQNMNSLGNDNKKAFDNSDTKPSGRKLLNAKNGGPSSAASSFRSNLDSGKPSPRKSVMSSIKSVKSDSDEIDTQRSDNNAKKDEKATGYLFVSDITRE